MAIIVGDAEQRRQLEAVLGMRLEALESALAVAADRVATGLRTAGRKKLRKAGISAKALKNPFGMLRSKRPRRLTTELEFHNFRLSMKNLKARRVRPRGGDEVVKAKPGRRVITFRHAFMFKAREAPAFVREHGKITPLTAPGDERMEETSETIDEFADSFYPFARDMARKRFNAAIGFAMRRATRGN